MAKPAIKNWSTCQDLTLTQQLELGVRYMDLRVAPKPGSEDIYMVHALYGRTVAQCMTEINDFLNQHTKEIVLLDFNHFFDMTAVEHTVLISALMDIFGQKMCQLLDADSLTLENLWSSGLQVIVFYHNEIVSDYLQFWPGSFIPVNWINTLDIDQLLIALETKYSTRHSDTTFNGTHGILSTDANYIMAHLGGNLKENLAAKIAKPFVDWLKNKRAGPNGINVCLMDFVQLQDYVSTVINLNSKGA